MSETYDPFAAALTIEMQRHVEAFERDVSWMLVTKPRALSRRRARRLRVITNRLRREMRWPSRWAEIRECRFTAPLVCTAPGWNGRFTIDPAPAPVEPERPRYVRHYVEGE